MTDQPVYSKELLAKIQPVIAETLGVPIEKITPQARFTDDLGADSLDTVELLMALEEALGIQVRNEEAEKLNTVQDLLAYLESQQKGPST